MPNPTIEPCPGCGLAVGPTDGPRHPYIGSSPGCWALFNELLVSGPGGDVPGQLAGDAYAVQHPGALERRAIQSACVHAINLCARLEWDYPEKRVKDLMRTALTHPEWWRPFGMPTPIGTITVADVVAEPDPESRAERTMAWAKDIWAVHAPHHELVRGWVTTLIGSNSAASARQRGAGRQTGRGPRRSS